MNCKKKLRIIIVLSPLLLLACFPEHEYQIQHHDQSVIDSIYQKKADSLNIILDSLCSKKKDSLLRITVDSIKYERILQIQKILTF